LLEIELRTDDVVECYLENIWSFVVSSLCDHMITKGREFPVFVIDGLVHVFFFMYSSYILEEIFTLAFLYNLKLNKIK